MEAQMDKLAQILVEYALELRSGDLVRLRGEIGAAPLISAIFKRAVEIGALPLQRLALPGQQYAFMRYATESLLDTVSPSALWEVENITADLTLFSDSNTRELSHIDPARLTRVQKANMPVVARWMERAFADPPAIRWCASLFPTPALAQDAGMSTAEFAEFAYRAMFLDQPDPVASWRALSRQQDIYCAYLNKTQDIRIEAEDTDLHLSVAGRTWINADGRVNFPDGEVFTGPIETSARGTIRYKHPTNYHSREIVDIRLWFEDGLVTKWDAAQGKEVLDELFAVEGARRLGEVAIGNNYSIPTFIGNILFDEKIGGTCHLAVGKSIPGTGGTNVSAVHWDMICDLRDGGRITADGDTIHENGVWKIGQ